MRFERLAALIAVSSLFPAAASFGADDVLVMRNGDRITGEITKIWDREITIEPAYSDEFTVDVPAVAYIDARRDFEIELADGTSVVAQLHGGDAEGNQVLIVDGEEIVVMLSQLDELEEPQDRFDWDTLADWSASVNSGNTDTLNTKLRANTKFRIGDHRHIAELTISREEQNRISVKEQDLLKYNYNWIFTDAWFFNAGASFERDPIRELDYRVVTSAGLGLDIFDEPRITLNVSAGGGYITENIGGSEQQSSAGLWALRYRQDFFSEDLELFHNHTITRYLSGRDNTIYKTSTGLRYEITDLLYANVSLDYDYETQPVDTAVSEDIALLFGVGVEL